MHNEDGVKRKSCSNSCAALVAGMYTPQLARLLKLLDASITASDAD